MATTPSTSTHVPAKENKMERKQEAVSKKETIATPIEIPSPLLPVVVSEAAPTNEQEQPNKKNFKPRLNKRIRTRHYKSRQAKDKDKDNKNRHSLEGEDMYNNSENKEDY